MIQVLAISTQEEGGAFFLKIILFLYFIPTMISILRSPILKFKIFTVLFINLFFGWTVYGWWLAFGKAFSS
ncbi:superinfection immunity protein [Chryseobacterium caseinilyticum]|uniref:Superinfection immunity protein n=1 Tax=Chryseobacterium caseinilyticum TaxID=2771428 RepID=A0ABR8ZDT0_9FLAO|nr:superinfection immunity protein [Chryseobacterium caseinilyticum]MBD8083008.1 superinfection immunity protein [Chryseobacterium caseinilyticum]